MGCLLTLAALAAAGVIVWLIRDIAKAIPEVRQRRRSASRHAIYIFASPEENAPAVTPADEPCDSNVETKSAE